MAKKIMMEKKRTTARPTIRRVASDSVQEYAMPGTHETTGLTNLDSIIAGIASQLQYTAQPARPWRRGRSRTRIIAISGFEEVRFEIEIKSTGVPGGARGKKVNGFRTAVAPKRDNSKRIRKSMTHSAKS